MLKGFQLPKCCRSNFAHGSFGVADVTTEAVSYQNFLNTAMPTQMALVSVCSNYPAGDQ
jgi:hypothetical protein